jgi:hypothetical protein
MQRIRPIVGEFAERALEDEYRSSQLKRDREREVVVLGALVDVLTVMFVYLAFRLPLARQMLVASLFSVGVALHVFSEEKFAESPEGLAIGVALLLTNSLGYLISHRWHESSRLQFVAFSNERLLRRELEVTLAEVRALRGILPICSRCKRIRDEDDCWHAVEVYVREHSDAEFTHSLCPECSDLYIRDL